MPHRKLREIVEGQDLLHLPPTASVAEAVRKMQQRRFSAMPVIEDGKLVGIFTSSNLVKRVFDPGLDPEETTLADVMTPDPVCIHADCEGFEAIRLMEENNVRHVMVEGCGPHGFALVTTDDFPDQEIAAFAEELEFEHRLWEEL